MPNLTWYGSPNFTPGRLDVEYVVIHWMDGYLAGADATFQNTARQTSAHYGVEDDTIHQYVDEANTAWHAGDFEANRRSIGIEHSAMPGRPASDATYASTIWLITGICQRHGLIPGPDTILPHQHFTSTSCPGTMDLPRIIAGVQSALGGVTTQSGTITPIEQDWFDMATLDDLRAVVQEVIKPTQDRVLGGIPAGPARDRIPGVPRATDNGDVWDIRQDIKGVANALVTIAQGVGEIKAKPATASAPLDVKALAAELAPLLNVNQVEQFVTEIRNLKFSAQ